MGEKLYRLCVVVLLAALVMVVYLRLPGRYRYMQGALGRAVFDTVTGSSYHAYSSFWLHRNPVTVFSHG